MTRRISTALLFVGIFCAPVSAATYVAPPAYWYVEAICGAGDLVHTVRDQTIYSSALFTNGPMLIQELRYRPCTGSATFTNTLPSVQINFSTTLSTPNSASTTYANNVGADNTIVFQGAASLSSRVTGPPGGAKEFDIVFPLLTPFFYNPAAGNLLVDLRHNTSDPATHVDVSSNPNGEAARIFSVDPNAASGAKDSGANIIQLILVESNTPPYLGTQPQSQNVPLGSTATFTVAAAGSVPLRYQWSWNSAPLANATNASLVLTNVSPAQTGVYFVTVTNLYGAVQSSNAALQVYAVPPAITTPPQSQKVAVGANVSFSVVAAGSPPLGYQWTFEGAPVLNATNATLNLPSVTLANEGQYRVTVSSPYGSAPSAIATLQFFEPSSFYDHPEPPGPGNRRSPLVISEIMYHPLPRVDGREGEFVEIYNSGAIPIRLDGYRLTGEYDFTFPADTILAGYSYLVVAPAPGDIQAIYGTASVTGGFLSRLANGGGTLRLRNDLGAILVEVDYSDHAPWPLAADGGGHSLVLARPSLGEKNPPAWAASAATGGSPGGPDPIPAGALSRVVLNEIAAHTNAASAFVELFNRGGASADLSGCILTDDPATNRFRVAPGTTIAARGWISFNAAQLGFAPGLAGGKMFLLNSNATRVLDAAQYDGQRPGYSLGRSPDGEPVWRELNALTSSASNAPPVPAEIVISEIMYHPISGLDDDQFVEIHNRSTGAVNLSGWKFTDGITFSFPSNTLLAAHASLAVAKNAARLLTNYPGLSATNCLGNFQGRLSGRGERLVLTRPHTVITATATSVVQVVANEMSYGTGGRWGTWSDGGGASLELIHPDADNRLASNWADSAAPTNAPWATIEYTGPHEFHDAHSTINGVELSLLGAGECLVDDVEVTPSGGANRVTNPNFSSGTNGWMFDGSYELSGVDANGGTGNGACLHLRAPGRGDYLGSRVSTAWATALSQATPATLRVKARWLRGWPELLMRLRGNTLEATGPLAVPANLGTPGLPNSQARTNVGPAIWDVSHTPVLPAANQPVLVTARVSDPNNVTNVTLRYRLDPSATVTSLAMRDDGTGGDLAARDGIFTATLPGQSSGALVAFHVRAWDGTGTTNQFPANAPTREGLVRFGEALPPGTLGAYRMWMTAATRSAWINRSFARINNRSLDVTFVYNDQRAIYNAGAAYNGSDNTSEGYDAPDGAPCGYTIQFPTDDAFLNTDEIVLDWPGRDSTGQREQLSYWMAARAGLPFNHRRYVRLYVNGIAVEQRPQADGTQIYEDLQTPGGDFLDEWYEGGGNDLYKVQVWRRDYQFPARPGGETYHATLENFVNQAGQTHLPRYRWNWRKRAPQDSANDYSDLFDLIAVGNAANSAHYFAAVNSFMNVEQWMRTFAFERVLGNFDSYGNRNAHNMYAVKPAGKRWQLLTFDNDLVFGSTSEGTSDNLFGTYNPPPGGFGVPDPVATTKLRDGSPAAQRAYWRAFRDFVNGPMQPTNYLPFTSAQYSMLLAGSVVQANGSAVADPSSLASWIDARRSYIQSQLNTVAASFAVTAPPNGHTTNRNLVTLTGTSPIEVEDLLLNGVKANVTWTATTAWSLQAVLTNGANILAIHGLDSSGATNFTTSRTVHFTGTNDAPEGRVVLNELLYRPTVTNAEFIEIFNRSTSTAFDLAGWRINGTGLEFNRRVILAPTGFVVVARSLVRFGKAHGFSIPVAAEFEGELDLDGETLSLLRPVGTNEFTVDAVTFGATPPWPVFTNATRSLQLIDAAQPSRRPANWASATPTPGAANVVAQSLPAIPSLWLNELQPVNATGIFDNFSEHEPWVELFNAGTGTVSLAGLYLTTNYSNLVQWALPVSSSMGAQSFKLIWLDGQTNQTTPADLHAPFRPLPTTGSLALVWVNGGRTSVLDYLNYAVSGPDRSFGAFPDGQARTRQELYFATPAATNSAALPLPALRLNEWMAANTHTVANPVNGNYDDWFEIFNASSNAVNLADWSLTDTLLNPRQYVIPTNVTLAAGGFLLVWAEGNARPPDANGGLHVNFKLSASGEGLALFAPNQQVVDFVFFGAQTGDISEGVWPDGAAVTPHFMVTPTPRAPNSPPNPEPQLLPGGVSIGAGGAVTIRWTSHPARTYRVQFKASLDDAGWTDLPGDVPANGNIICSKTDSGAGGASQRFYRVLALP